MVLHRAGTEEEGGRDLAVGPSRDEQAQHLDLAIGEGDGAGRRELLPGHRDGQREGHRVLEAEIDARRSATLQSGPHPAPPALPLSSRRA